MKDAAQTLNGLHMHARDMVRAYTAALDRVQDVELREHLLAFRLDHTRHLSDATALVLRLGGQPKGRRDARGPLVEGMAAVSALWSDLSALRALERCEEVGLRHYHEVQRVLGYDCPAEVRLGLQDHARHLGWLRDAIREREQLGEARM